MNSRLIQNIINLIKSDDAVILDKLLKHEKNIDLNEYRYLNGQNITFLGLAVISKSYEVSMTLINHGASLNCYIENDTIPIYLLKSDSSSGYHLLFYSSFDDKMLTLDGLESFFSVLILKKDDALIEKSKNFISIDTINTKNQSLLWFAALTNNIKLIDFFIRKNLNVYQEDDNGIAPIRFLIKNDIKLKFYDDSYIDSKGNDLLMIALQENNLELAKLILIDYQNFKFFNHEGVTVLELMVKKLDLNYLKLIYLKNPEIFLFLKPMKIIFSELMKRNLEIIAIKLIAEFEDRLNFFKIIEATIENDQLEVFNYIRPKYIIEYNEDFDLFDLIIKQNAIKIMIHIINQKIFFPDTETKSKIIWTLNKLISNQNKIKALIK